MNMKKIISIVKLLGLYLLTGVICGVIGTLFSKGILLVTNMRHDNSWLLYFLPVAGVLTVAIYKLLDLNGVGTNQVIKSADGKTVLSPKLAPAVFCASLLSHLCGASVGREGAALQLGGSFAALLSKCFKLTEEQGKILVYCGMAGVFSSVFGTPFSAAAFALEVVIAGRIYYPAVIPAIITSLSSYYTADLLGGHAERFVLSAVPTISFSVMWKLLALSLLTVVLGVIFCLSLKYLEKLFEKLFKMTFYAL